MALVNHSKCILLRQTRVRGLMLLKCGAFNDGGAGSENLCRHCNCFFTSSHNLNRQSGFGNGHSQKPTSQTMDTHLPYPPTSEHS